MNWWEILFLTNERMFSKTTHLFDLEKTNKKAVIKDLFGPEIEKPKKNFVKTFNDTNYYILREA